VRLKENEGVICQLDAKFQFHFGAIKSSLGKFKLKAIAHFNSTLVRLKVCQFVNGNLLLLIFQFHFGAIKRKLKN